MLTKIQKQTERFINDLKWNEEQINSLVSQTNRVISKNLGANNTNDDRPNDSLVTHPARYDGGFIVFGGWTNIYDQIIPAGTRGHRLYLAFGGLGVGGWKGDCDIELKLKDETFTHNGMRYYAPANHYGNNDWDGHSTGYQWFYDNVKSFMFMYLPVFMQPIPVFVYFDGHSNSIGISVPNCSLSVGIGGGTVSVKS